MNALEFMEIAKTKYVLSDGAMGTMLQNRGLDAGSCPELWNTERRDDVYAVHKAYVEAGSLMLGTNTFGGNRIKLASYKLENRVRELNVAGASVAREAAGSDAIVAASIGPTGKLLEPLGDLSADEAEDAFAEQALALAEGGAGVILMESFSDLTEIMAALSGALKTGLPCFCTMTFDSGGRTIMGIDPVTAANTLSEGGASGVGANCGLGPDGTLEIVRQIRQSTDRLVISQPNAGLPKVVGWRTIYDSTPEDMAKYATLFAEIGTNIIGGCCGTTPEHIKAMKYSLK